MVTFPAMKRTTMAITPSPLVPQKGIGKPMTFDYWKLGKMIKDNIKSLKGLRPLLYNNMLRKACGLSYNIKRQMRTDTGIMATSFGIFDDEYIVRDLNQISPLGKKRILSNIDNSFSWARRASIWEGQDDLRSPTAVYIHLGSRVPWLLLNENIIGNALGETQFIGKAFQKFDIQLRVSGQKIMREFINEVNKNKGKIRKIEEKLNYRDEESMKEIGKREVESLSNPASGSTFVS